MSDTTIGNGELHWEDWGHLQARYEARRPRRMLSLDGGGIRGVLTLEVLEQLEVALRDRYSAGPGFRLCQFFDYIGGTSTGAIIATALARGLSVAEIKRFYVDFGREVFRKRPLLERIKSLYDEGPLERKLREVYASNGKETDLSPEHLHTLLLVVTRNVTTDSAWPVSSNPHAKYNRLSRSDCNLRIPLWQLARASAAAPVFFSPEVLHLDRHDSTKSFVFADGGTTSYNCPAFLMYRMATEPAYQLRWERGERNLLLVSVGTGAAPVYGSEADGSEGNLITMAHNTLLSLMSQAAFDQDLSCRTIGRCTFGGKLDREVDTLVPKESLSKDLGRAFLYARYDAELTWSGLKELKLETEMDASRLNRLDAVDSIPDLQKVGKALAKRVDITNHFGVFADPNIAPLAQPVTA